MYNLERLRANEKKFSFLGQLDTLDNWGCVASRKNINSTYFEKTLEISRLSSARPEGKKGFNESLQGEKHLD